MDQTRTKAILGNLNLLALIKLYKHVRYAPSGQLQPFRITKGDAITILYNSDIVFDYHGSGTTVTFWTPSEEEE